jgi:hypothetical protein
MTLEEVTKFLNEEDCGSFEDIPEQERYSNRRDMHALILLDKLFPGSHDMIAAAEHDAIYIDVNLEELSKVVKKEDLITLSRCGICPDDVDEGLMKFV